jgi:hypothetical protein
MRSTERVSRRPSRALLAASRLAPRSHRRINHLALPRTIANVTTVRKSRHSRGARASFVASICVASYIDEQM